jgi:hypothetical protein
MSGTAGKRRRLQLSWDLRTFISIAILIATPANALMLLFQSEYHLESYFASTSVEMLFFGALLLLLVIPRVKDKSFRITALLIAIGFFLQLISSSLRYYYGYVAEPAGIPPVSVGDFFHLGSYFVWAAASATYLKRYWRLMSGRPFVALTSYAAIGITASLIGINFWHNSADYYGYDAITTAVRVSYIIVPSACLTLPLSAALIYALDGFGRGLKRYYWMYSLISICLIASSDILRGTSFAIHEADSPMRIDYILALTGFAFAISAALRLLRSHLDTVSMAPIVLEGGAASFRIELRSGRGYIVEDEKSDLGFEMFRQSITIEGVAQNQRGYIISKIDSIEIGQKYGLKGMKFILLKPNASIGSAGPTAPTMLALSIREFLLGAKNGVILLDGIELLIADYGSRRVNTLLEEISDLIKQYHGYLIMPVNRNALGENEMAKMEALFESIRIRRAALE